MFLSTIRAQCLALRPNSLVLPHLTTQYRSLSTSTEKEPYWQKIEPWKDVTAEDFKSYRWQLANTVPDTRRLHRFLSDVLPPVLGTSKNRLLSKIRTREQFIEDATAALKLAPMAIRLTPHLLSVIDWENPLDDPIRRQFLPLASGIVPDHQKLTLDSLNEQDDSPVPGLVHRYPGRALFLATSICPVYCRFCTRSYAVGANTETVSKSPQKPSRRRWEVVFQHIENDPSLHDIVVSGGDAYYLQPEDLREIGERLLSIPHIQRIRFASKGLAVAPCRIADETDPWTNVLIELSNKGRDMAKQVCLHTHINHVNEITWVTREAANRLFKHGVIVRNQSVLLKDVNDTKEALSNLIEALASMNIQPYYIYQCDMVRGIEDLRTPLRTILDLDKELRGTLSGFMMPSFVIDLPGGGGKRLVSTCESYDETTGVAVYRAPGLPGKKGTQTYEYHDPKPVSDDVLEELRQEQEQALEQNLTLQDLVSPVAPPRPSMPLRRPPFDFDIAVPRKRTPASIRRTAVKPEALALQLSTTNYQPSSSAAAA
ncbi:kama family protein [Didymella exigua CBS 183.55]|uniref:Kama family protein n=1 Tax=Didymella exigua CBS 183.55 TaxID=1150837 RepID=A0A6A5RBU6_9PLEO|nr:kama family protein [Didymella exigua CBS 183.55]KAF1924668.1 kama family protein [Didymella exigua CBS 183.55]